MSGKGWFMINRVRMLYSECVMCRLSIKYENNLRTLRRSYRSTLGWRNATVKERSYISSDTMR